MSDAKSVQAAFGVPRLRTDLEYVPVTHRGRRGLLIRDPLELSPGPILVQGKGLTLLSLIDGRRSLSDIQVALVRLGNGVFVPAEEVAGLVSELEEAGILESPRIEEKRRRLIEDYSGLKVRPACLAGRAYPGDRRELEELIDGILESGEDVPAREPPSTARALVAPHIDLDSGRRAYARAYGALCGLPAPRRVLLLGTGHALGSEFFSLTEKDFESPLGRVSTDRERVRSLRDAAGPVAARDDFGHRAEHSLEFQLLFLQRLFGSEFLLTPLLCGSFQDELPRRRRAAEIPAVGNVLNVLAGFLEQDGPGTLVVAGVDLSHIGPKFGHELGSAALEAETRRHDRILIDSLRRVDPEAFWEEVRSSGDRYNVCGFSTLACLLEVLSAAGLRGNLLDYDLRPEPATRSAVSFASLAFYSAESIESPAAEGGRGT